MHLLFAYSKSRFCHDVAHLCSLILKENATDPDIAISDFYSESPVTKTVYYLISHVVNKETPVL